MSSEPQVSSELSRDLTLFQVTMMGLGMMIGAGVFLAMGPAIGRAGPGGGVLTFALGGIVAICTAMSYAELSSAIPRAGGAYNFARVAFGRGTSFVAGWMEWLASSIAGSLYAVCFAEYTIRFFRQLGVLDCTDTTAGIVAKLVAVAIAALFIYVNYRGASETGKLGAIMTLAQTLFLCCIGLVGIVVVVRDPSRLANFEPFINHAEGGWTTLLVTMGLTAVAFEGYEVISQAGDETIDPRRNMPKAMLYSVLIVTLTYVAVAAATIVGVKAGPHLAATAGNAIELPGGEIAPWQWIASHGEKGFGASIELLIPKFGGFLVVLAVIFASTSALNATIFSATRASYALGRDRMLPAFFAKISEKRKTPWVALTLTGVIVVLMATLLDVRQVVASASIMFLLLFLMVNVCVIKIRRNMGDELQYGFVMPLFPLFPIVAIVAQITLTFFLHKIGITAQVIAITWITAGVLIYQFYSRHHAKATGDEVHILEEQEAEEGHGHRVMVAVANVDNALSLVRTTYSICGAMGSSVELIHMVPVPNQVPLADASAYMDEGKEAFAEVMLYLQPQFPISSTMRYCRNVARGIVTALREKKCNLLIMGWHGQTHRRAFSLGSTVDPVIELSPCDVLILKDCGDKKFKNILVPMAGGPNGLLALRTAGLLADRYKGRITAFSASPPDRSSRFDLQVFLKAHAAELPMSRITAKTVFNPVPADAIIGEAHDEQSGYDLVILGCSRLPWFRRTSQQSLPDHLAEHCDRPIIMASAATGIRSIVNLWL